MPKDNNSKKIIACNRCSGTEFKDVTGLMMGDPLRNNKTTWLIQQCLKCNFTRLIKRNFYKGKETEEIVESKPHYADEEDPEELV